MGETAPLDPVLDLASRLTVVDKIRLIERVAPRIEEAIEGREQRPRKSLRGAWRGQGVSDEGIAAVRREMWAGYPREDSR